MILFFSSATVMHEGELIKALINGFVGRMERFRTERHFEKDTIWEYKKSKGYKNS